MQTDCSIQNLWPGVGAAAGKAVAAAGVAVDMRPAVASIPPAAAVEGQLAAATPAAQEQLVVDVPTLPAATAVAVVAVAAVGEDSTRLVGVNTLLALPAAASVVHMD